MGRVLEPEVMEGEFDAAAYDELDRRWGDVLFQGFAESALRMGVAAGRVLDVGTGSGRIAIRLAKLNPAFHIEGVDLSRSMLALAERNARAEAVDNVTFSIGDAKGLPFPDHTFDLVISHQLLHQLPEPRLALREMYRVAKPVGAILVRDVRRLCEPFMTLLLPLWCLRRSPALRAHTRSSFRAGLTYREFADLAREVGGAETRIRTFLLTHIGMERLAVPYRRCSDPRLPRPSLAVRLMKSRFLMPHPRFPRGASRG